MPVAPGTYDYWLAPYVWREETHLAIDPDISAVHWMTLDEIKAADLRSPLVLRGIQDNLERPLLPLSIVSHL